MLAKQCWLGTGWLGAGWLVVAQHELDINVVCGPGDEGLCVSGRTYDNRLPDAASSGLGSPWLSSCYVIKLQHRHPGTRSQPLATNVNR